MKHFLLIAPISMLAFILFWGSYSLIVFLFIAAFLLLPPFLLKYRTNPERAIYFFFITYITVPKYIRTLPLIGTYDLPGISYFDIIKTTVILHIIVLIILSKFKTKMPKNIRNLIKVFFFTIVVSTIFGSIKYYYSYESFPTKMLLGGVVEGFIYPFYGLIILFGLFTFIKRMEQVEVLIGVFAVSGILILLDFILINYLGLFGFLKFWVSQGERYKGLFFGDYMNNGLFSVITSFALAYFILKKKKYILLPFLLLMLFPIHATYERTVYITYFTGVIVFVWVYFKGKNIEYKVFAVLFSIGFLLAVFYNLDAFINTFNKIYAGDVRNADFTNSQSFYSRLGAWLRSLDVFVYMFPFGTGEGLSQQYLNANFIPTLTGSLVNQQSSEMYSSLISGVKTTKAHNIFIHFVSEHGLLGIIAMVMYIKILLKNYFYSKFYIKNRDQLLFVATVYAMVFGLGAYYMVESAERLYFLYSLLLFLSVFIIYNPDKELKYFK